MLIWPLIWPSAAENDRKMTGKSFFYNCFFQGSMSTPNEIRSWFSTWTLVLTNIFILWTKIGRGRPVTPPPGGVTTPKSKKHVLGHVTYQSKAHEKLYSNMSIECSFDHSFDRQQLKMTGKSFFYNCFFQGSMSTPNEIRSWFSSWILVLTYIFISWTKIGRGWHVTPPPGGGNHPKIKETCLWSCDISIESAWKALFKYVNWMLIWPLIWPSAAENNRKIILL